MPDEHSRITKANGLSNTNSSTSTGPGDVTSMPILVTKTLTQMCNVIKISLIYKQLHNGWVYAVEIGNYANKLGVKGGEMGGVRVERKNGGHPHG